MFYAEETYNLATEKDRKLSMRVGELMWQARLVSKEKMGKRINTIFECHSICRAVILEIPDGSLRCVDGDLVGIEIGDDLAVRFHVCSHSWLVTENGAIIDPYPPGIMAMGPLLIVKG
ncbi:MAG: hypothetical protein WCV82_04020, partial [Candidatus Paceibacterota bacterium]